MQIHCFWCIPFFCLPSLEKYHINGVELFNYEFLEIFSFAASICFICKFLMHSFTHSASSIKIVYLFYSVKENIAIWKYIFAF